VNEKYERIAKDAVAQIVGVDTSVRDVDWLDVIQLLYKYEETTIDPYLNGYKQGQYDAEMDQLHGRAIDRVELKDYYRRIKTRNVSEMTPGGYVRSGELKGVKETLRILGIKIEGVNA